MNRFSEYKNKRTIICLSSIVFACIILGFISFGIAGNQSDKLEPPTDVMIQENVLFWQKNENAVGYIVSINGEETEVKTTEFKLDHLSEAKVYLLKVKALGDKKNNNNSKWSSTVSITRLAQPSLTVSKTNLEWNQIENNVGYELFHNNVKLAQVKKDVTTYDLLKETPSGEYTILAKGDGISTMDSAMSSKSSFKILDMPKNLTSNGKIISWDSVEGADYYIINGEFNKKNTQITTKKNSYNLKDIKPGKYKITVQAASEQKNLTSSNKSPITVHIEKIPLKLSGVTLKNGSVLWKKLDASNGYEIKIKSNNTLIRTVKIPASATEIFDLTGLKLKDGTYKIEVIAKGNDYYKDSPPHTFTYTEEKKVAILDRPYLGKIQNAGIDQGILKWNALAYASGYNVNIEKSNKIVYNFRIKTIEKLELDILKLLLEPGEYSVSLYALGNQSYNNSPAQKFQYTVVKLNTPENLALRGTQITWSSVKNADKYIVTFDNQSPITVTNTSYSISSALLPGVYTISVRALSDNIEVQASEKAVLQHTEPKYDMGSIKNIRIEEGLFKWDALEKATGYVAEIKNSTGIIRTDTITPTNDLLIDLNAINLPVGSYTITLKALGDNVLYKDSDTVSTTYQEKMIRGATVRANFNYGNKYSDTSQYWIQHYLNFSLKQGFTFDTVNVSSEGELNSLYTDFLSSSGDTKQKAAQKIGNDIMITYYYMNDQGQPVVLNTFTGLPFVKNKFWDGWLYQYNNGGYIGLKGTPMGGTSIGNIVPSNILLQVSANIGRQNPAGNNTPITSTQLDAIKGKLLYVSIDVIIRDGSSTKYYTETTSLKIQDY